MDEWTFTVMTDCMGCGEFTITLDGGVVQSGSVIEVKTATFRRGGVAIGEYEVISFNAASHTANVARR
ncbi:hypothetical protein KKG41_01715 [Patescibacteria group bacterium]|nr:hypothetical protein [Patescibacteria group bacterium]MBU1890494.1 hypothetical protein [Patescibacteria group bacterium]